ncbi:hypothetical protein BDV96DRAFT_598476 [Lophiotrema nucula]|uniref:SRR1-like domain-containing protein n=1 Tax=Lophiotrema nucula TaxID=690887 RepID=A0A6A5ZAU3_9PLEO|nr:hypothetical protein BDV96DRAFT_598476 [Lophiotrema nucula]
MDLTSLYNHIKDKPVFIRKRLQEAQDNMESLRQGDLGWGETDLDGEEWNPDSSLDPSQPARIHYESYQDMAQMLFGPDPIIPVGLRPSMEIQNPSYDVNDPKFRQWEKVWVQSTEREKLLSCINNSNRHSPITQIVCIGLGIPQGEGEDEDDPEVEKRNYVQHLAVRDMAQELARLQNTDVRVFAQDPQYNEDDKTLLEKLSITIVNDPEAFLKIDESTFVVAICTSFPVRQVVADLFLERGTKGPAGIWGHFDPGSDDPASERVDTMMSNFVGIWTIGEGDEFWNYFGDSRFSWKRRDG